MNKQLPINIKIQKFKNNITDKDIEKFLGGKKNTWTLKMHTMKNGSVNAMSVNQLLGLCELFKCTPNELLENCKYKSK